jgi:hypothetical protein
MKKKPSSRRKRSSTKAVLRLPDLEHARAVVLNSPTRRTQSGVIVTPSMNSLTGIVRNRACLPCFGRVVGADPISLGVRFGADDRTLRGGKQRIRSAVNDRIGTEPNP